MEKNKNTPAGLRRTRRRTTPSGPQTSQSASASKGANLIQDAGLVADLAVHLATEPVVAFDTEFIRERTFFPQLGLIQLANRKQAWLLDPVALGSRDLEPLLEIFTNSKILKVAHAVEQDQECLYSAYGIVAAPVLDTAIAAALTGRGDQIGLSALVQKVLGVRLPKGHTRTNWLKRPLPATMAKYALADVRHLVETAEVLLEDLDHRNRRDWAMRLSAEFARRERYEPNPEAIAERIAAGRRLDTTEYAVLRELTRWREERVRRANLPRRWLADDPLLVKLAHARPGDVDELANFRGLGAKTLQNGANDILKAIRRGVEMASAQPSQPPARPKAEPQEGPALAALKCFLQLLAHQHGVPSRFLVDPDQLMGLLRGRFRSVDELRRSGLLKAAAVDLFGEELIGVLNGRLALRMSDGQPEIYTP